MNNTKWLAASFCCLTMSLIGVFPHVAYANETPYVEFIPDQTVMARDLVEFVVKPVDPDGVVPSLYAVGLPAGATFLDNRNGTRTYAWRPNESQAGDHVVMFVTRDAVQPDLRHSQNVRISVVTANSSNTDLPAPPVETEPVPDIDGTPGNTVPQIEPLESVTVNPLELVSLRVVPRDAEKDVAGLVADGMPAGAEFVDNYDGTRTFLWTPTESQAGEHRLVFTAVDARDSSLRSTAETIVTVRNAAAENVVQETPPSNEADASGNRSPYFENMSDVTVDLGQILKLVVAPRDPDGDVPGMFADRLPANSSFQDNFDGTRTLYWRPYPSDLGDFWITFTAIDARDNSLRTTRSMKISVVVNGEYNFEPVINGINNPVIRAGDTLRQRVQPVDPDNDVPTLVVLDPPEGSTFPDNGDGTRSLVWTPGVERITEIDGIDNPHLVHFKAIDARDTSLYDDHELKVSVIPRNSVERQGERLRQLADRRGLLIGYAARLKSSQLADTQLYRDIAKAEFNVVTPENSHKWGWIQPERGEFDFEDADELADFAEKNGMVLHGHPLIWHRQLPQWVQNLPFNEVEQVMLDHITALTARYAGRVKIWDVVNEALEEDGTYRQSIWLKSMGNEFIAKSFQRAREVDPQAVLIYNDYDVAWKNSKSDAMYEMLRNELQAGTPIDGVGFQMHFWAQFDQFDDLRDNLQRFANLGLDIYITELDVAMNEQGTAQEQLQASVYEKVTRICLEQPRCRAIQTWGFTDRYSWRYNFRPLLFSERYRAKPAYYAIQSVLR